MALIVTIARPEKNHHDTTIDGVHVMNRSIPSPEHIQLKPGKPPARGVSRWLAYSPIAVVTLTGLAGIWYAFQEVNSWERQRVLQQFQSAASDRVLMIQRELDLTLAVVEDIGSFFDASQWVGRRDFRKFVGPPLKRHNSIVALEWIPRVKDAERNTFEADARRSFSKFRITERNQAGELVMAVQRPVHYPVLFVHPYQSNSEILGLDLAYDPSVVDALHTTRDTGHIQTTSPIPLVQYGFKEYGFAARVPVYDHGESNGDDVDSDKTSSLNTIEQRRLALRGFAAGIFRISAIVESALENISPAGIDITIHELSSEDEKEYFYRHVSRRRIDDARAGKPAVKTTQVNWKYVNTLSVSNRQWEVVCTSIPGYYQPDPWRGWIVLAGGLAFTTLLAVYLSTLMGSAARVRRLVTERTTQLVAVNEALNNEISERINTERELQSLNETLEQRVAIRTAEAEQHVKELEQFAYVTSHDLKAPLRGVANLAVWLEEDLKEKLTDTTREQLILLRDRVQRMHALIEGLLEYSRIGRTVRSIETVDVANLLTETIDSLTPPPGFIIDIATGMPTLRTERLQLYQVFSNLVGNAIKHRKAEQGHVWVKVADMGENYEFTVADDGPGIPPEYHDKAFMMFQTLEARDYGSNTGIGLALVKKIVEDHGGSITLESGEGKGATFRFTWPKLE